MTTPIPSLKILLIENDPAVANEIRAAAIGDGGGSSSCNGFVNFPRVLSA